MTTAINFYLDGMLAWGDMSYAEQVWVWINRPAFCPAGAALAMMGQ